MMESLSGMDSEKQVIAKEDKYERGFLNFTKSNGV